jgi:hypothetical protein
MGSDGFGAAFANGISACALHRTSIVMERLTGMKQPHSTLLYRPRMLIESFRAAMTTSTTIKPLKPSGFMPLQPLHRLGPMITSDRFRTTLKWLGSCLAFTNSSEPQSTLASWKMSPSGSEITVHWTANFSPGDTHFQLNTGIFRKC